MMQRGKVNRRSSCVQQHTQRHAVNEYSQHEKLLAPHLDRDIVKTRKLLLLANSDAINKVWC